MFPRRDGEYLVQLFESELYIEMLAGTNLRSTGLQISERDPMEDR